MDVAVYATSILHMTDAHATYYIMHIMTVGTTYIVYVTALHARYMVHMMIVHAPRDKVAQ